MIFVASFTMHSCVGSSYRPIYEEYVDDPLSGLEDDPGFEDDSVEFPEEFAENDNVNVIYGSSLEKRIQSFKERMVWRIESQSSAIGICYDKILEKHPNAEGKITIKFVIGEGYLYFSGKKTNIKGSKVLTAHVEQDTVRSSELSSCIIDSVKKSIKSLISPPGGQKATITYSYSWVFKKHQ